MLTEDGLFSTSALRRNGLTPVYRTKLGIQILGDSLDVLAKMPSESVNLVVTSPPFALIRAKAYGNHAQEAYVDWISEFGEAVHRVLRADGSLVLDLGGAYEKGKPVRSLYNYRVLLRFVDELSYFLAEEFFWYNPAKLPSPIEWVNRRKIRAVDAVNTVWWFSKSEWPKADVRNVLRPYSEHMKKLLSKPDKYYSPGLRPSEHSISSAFARDNGGSIPKNLLQISNTESSNHYMRTCRMLGIKSHPARFPAELPAFFIKFLTDENDIVLDIFSGSNTVGATANALNRRWLSVELDKNYVRQSAIRFMDNLEPEEIVRLYETIDESRITRLQAPQAPESQSLE